MIRKLFCGLALAAGLMGAAGSAVAAPRDGFNAKEDRFATFVGQRIRISFGSVLDNDTCRRNCRGPLRVVRAFGTSRTQGTVRIRNGRIVFIPAPGFTGVTRFKYAITDRRGRTISWATIRIRVRASANGLG